MFTDQYKWLLDRKHKICLIGKEIKKNNGIEQTLSDRHGNTFTFACLTKQSPYYGTVLVQKCDPFWKVIQTFTFTTLNPFTHNNDSNSGIMAIGNGIRSMVMDMTAYEKKSRKRKQAQTQSDEETNFQGPPTKKLKHNNNISQSNNNNNNTFEIDDPLDDDDPMFCPFCGFKNGPHASKCDKCSREWNFV